MIENIRKYTGLMIVVLALLFIGLVFLEGSANNLTSGKPVMNIAGKGVSEKEFRRLAVNPLEIPQRVGNGFLSRQSQELAKNYVGDAIEGNPFLGTRGGLLQFMNFSLQGDQPDRFLANRVAVQKAGLEYGATPGPDEIEDFIETILFADPEGNFDQPAWDDFIDNKLGSLGIGIRGFKEYIRDLLTAQNLSNLIAGEIAIDPEIAASLHRNQSQEIVAQQVMLESSDLELAQNPTDEEIKAYWEENQGNYNTDERRKISYVFIEPNWDEALKTANEEKAKADAEAAKRKAEADANRKKLEDEAKKAEAAAAKANAETAPQPETPQPAETPAETPAEGAQGDPGAQGEPATPEPVTEQPAAPAADPFGPTPAAKPKPAAPAAPKAEPIVQSAKDQLDVLQKQKAVKALNETLTAFYNPLVDLSTQSTFAEHATELGHKVTTTDFFTAAEPPKPLDLRINNSSFGTLANAIYQIPAEAKDDQRISYPFETNDGWFVGQLEEVEASRPLTFEEAKVKVTVDLKKKLAREQLAKDAAALQEKLTAAVAAGKTFEEAAKENGDLKVTKLPSVKVPASRYGPATIPPAFDAARYTAPGAVAPVKFIPTDEQPERAFIILVDERKVVVDEAYNQALATQQQSESLSLRLATFQNWLRDRYDENEVETFSTQE